MPPFSCSGSFDFRLGDEPVVQADNAADDVDGFSAGKSGADDAGTGRLDQRCVSRNHCGDGKGSAGKIDGLRIQIILGEDAGVFGDPNHQLIGADAAVADGNFCRLRARTDGPTEYGASQKKR